MSPAEYEALLLLWTKQGEPGTAVVDATAAWEWLRTQPEDAGLPFPREIMTRLPFTNMWVMIRCDDGGVLAGWFLAEENGWCATWSGVVAVAGLSRGREFCEMALATEPTLQAAVHRVRRCGDEWRASEEHDFSAILVGLMNVANVSPDFTEASRTARKIAAKVDARGEGPTRYRKLSLRPFCAVDEAEHRQRERTALMPWHFVRGHFVTYTADRPLFGRYTGTFWVPSHARGNPAIGRRINTYAIEPAEQPTP